MDVYLDDVRVSAVIDAPCRVNQARLRTSYLVDLDSKGCTQLDGRRLTPFQAAPLRNGSRIRIVDYELIFHDQAVELNNDLPGRGDSTILESLDNLSTEHLARRSVEPAQALKAILEINRAVGGGAELNEVLNRALRGVDGGVPRCGAAGSSSSWRPEGSTAAASASGQRAGGRNCRCFPARS